MSHATSPEKRPVPHTPKSYLFRLRCESSPLLLPIEQEYAIVSGPMHQLSGQGQLESLPGFLSQRLSGNLQEAVSKKEGRVGVDGERGDGDLECREES